MKTKSKDFSNLLKWTLRKNAPMMILSSFLSVCFALYIFFYPKEMGSIHVGDSDYVSQFMYVVIDKFIYVAAALFLLCFIQVLINFRFLYSKRQIDFISSSPVKREWTFAANSFSVILNISFFILIFFALLAGLKNDAEFPLQIQPTFLNLAVIFSSAVLLSATVSLFAVCEGRLVNVIFSSLCALFLVPLCFALFFSYAGTLTYPILLDIETVSMFFPVSFMYSPFEQKEEFLTQVIIIRIVLSLLLFAAGAYAMKKRKSEKASESKPSLLTTIILVPSFSFSAFFSMYVFMSNKGFSSFAVFAAAITIITVFFLTYVFIILKVRGKREIAVSVTALVCLICIPVFTTVIWQKNAEEFISYVPKVSEIESVSFNKKSGLRINPKDTIAIIVGKPAIEFNHDTALPDKITSKEAIQAVVDLHTSSIKNELFRKDSINTDICAMTLTYNLTNGKKVSRNVFIPFHLYYNENYFSEDVKDSYIRFFSSPEYLFQETADVDEITAATIECRSSDTIQEPITADATQEDAQKLFEAYKKDMKELFEAGLYEKGHTFTPYFRVEFSYKNSNDGKTDKFIAAIDPTYTNCAQIIQKYNLEKKLQPSESANRKMFVSFLTLSRDSEDETQFYFSEEPFAKQLMLEKMVISDPTAFLFYGNFLSSIPEIDDPSTVEKFRKIAMKQTAEEKIKTLQNRDYVVLFSLNAQEDYSQSNRNRNGKTYIESGIYVISMDEFLDII